MDTAESKLSTTKTDLILKIYAGIATALTILFLVLWIVAASDSSSDNNMQKIEPANEVVKEVVKSGANEEWCHVFNASAYDGAGAWVPTLNMRENFKAWDMEH